MGQLTWTSLLFFLFSTKAIPLYSSQRARMLETLTSLKGSSFCGTLLEPCLSCLWTVKISAYVLVVNIYICIYESTLFFKCFPKRKNWI